MITITIIINIIISAISVRVIVWFLEWVLEIPPGESQNLFFLRHQLIYYKKSHSRAWDSGVIYTPLLPRDLGKPLSFSVPRPPLLWSRSNNASKIFPTTRQCLQRALSLSQGSHCSTYTCGYRQMLIPWEPIHSVGHWMLWVPTVCQASSEGLGNNDKLVTPALNAACGGAHMWSKDFDFTAERQGPYADQTDPNWERRKGRKFIFIGDLWYSPSTMILNPPHMWTNRSTERVCVQPKGTQLIYHKADQKQVCLPPESMKCPCFQAALLVRSRPNCPSETHSEMDSHWSYLMAWFLFLSISFMAQAN